MKNLILIENRTMTLKDITDLLEVRHNDAMVTVSRMAESTEFGDVTKSSYRTKMGNFYETYELNQRQSIAVSARLNTALLMRVIDRWHELESGLIKIPQTLSQALRLAADKQDQLDEANLKLEYAKPRVEFADRVRNMDGACSISCFAKTIGTGQNRFFKQLRDDGYLMINNIPRQRYIEQGYFVVIEAIPYTDSKGKTHPAFKTMITGKGQVVLEKKYREVELA